MIERASAGLSEAQAGSCAIDVFAEDVALLRDLARRLPGRPAYHTVRDWCLVGRVNMHTRRRVRMESIRLPTGLASSVEAYVRFIRRLSCLE